MKTPAYLGIDIGGTNIKGAVGDCRGTLLARSEVQTKAELGPEGVLDRVEELALGILEQAHLDLDDVAALGLGVPGLIDFQRGMVIHAPNLRWEQLRVRELLESRLGRRVYIDNDANLAALGEKWLGAGRVFRSFLMVTIGTGIGSGLILNDQLYRGSHGLAPELGHIVVRSQNGYRCNCGSWGCLETEVAAPAIVRRARACGVEPKADGSLEARDVFARAILGDEKCLLVVQETAEILGTALANCNLMLDLDGIVIGGGVAQAKELLLDQLTDVIVQRSPFFSARGFRPKVVLAELGNLAGCIGAIRLAQMESK